MMPTVRSTDIVPMPPNTTLSYDQSNTLSLDISFRGRVKIACLKFAKYISAEAPSQPAHNTRVRWAQNTIQNPDQVAGQIQPNTVMQDAVQAQGSAISDQDLQTAVEVAINGVL